MQDEFSVNITSCTAQDGVYHIAIDRDVIRAEGGGQAGEKGTIHSGSDTIKITNTITLESGAMLIADAPVQVGKEVTIKIDMEWRLQMMRNHTAEHLFVSQLKRINPDIDLGYIWIDGDAGTVEILGTTEINQMFEVEKEVQLRINERHPIISSLISPEEVTSKVRARDGVQTKHDQIRIIKIEGVDESACSGIHAINTSDIGVFKIQDIRIYDESTRVHFVTSKKAIELLAYVFNEALARKQMYPFEMEQLGMVLDKAKKTSESREHLMALAVKLLAEDTRFETVNGIRFTHLFLPGFDTRDLRMCLKALPTHEKSATLLFSPGQKSSIIFWVNGLSHPASAYVSKIVEEMGGKGGGSKDSYTGGFGEAQEPQVIYNKIVQMIRKNLVT
ncbi:MAG: hypothetical protein P1Q69_02195 [Candidatus Thorarchaeota archaeon]|nr:hypothetical protein [Candidatus Thorarchaeota archaeon]